MKKERNKERKNRGVVYPTDKMGSSAGQECFKTLSVIKDVMIDCQAERGGGVSGSDLRGSRLRGDLRAMPRSLFGDAKSALRIREACKIVSHSKSGSWYHANLLLIGTQRCAYS